MAAFNAVLWVCGLGLIAVLVLMPFIQALGHTINALNVAL